ncbi:MHS family MFS transporter [Pseudonocardia sp. DR1-2]|uniref:MFS transporter n=1 Tax=Pseudonocardia sp. DR1-2 TaxID=2951168 RepID=UPI002043B036|nr:MFS transporter [Pseudonocardia sp. DR1-2]MCM3847133.1 MHS family MFS transporter [Pseudonocardia sp. DR1-2]
MATTEPGRVQPPTSTGTVTDGAVNAAGARPREARRASVAAFLGCLLEYYDFFIYGSAAALVFNVVFFPAGDPATATVLSLATFGVAYVARPLGAVVFGHFGDRVGRRGVLITTLLLMGLSSVAIGLLPSYETAGVLAPVLLVVCRLIQGLSAGGEAAGASTLTMEYAPEGRRAFYTSFTMSGFAAGMVLATLVFVPVAAMPRDQMLSWGWRIPFLLSVVVVAVTYMIRRRLDESPVFTGTVAGDAADHGVGAHGNDDGHPEQMPLLGLVRTRGRDLLRVVGCSLFAVFQTLFAVFGLAYATSDAVGMDRASVLWVTVAANGVAIVAIPAWALLSDRIGRKPVWVFGALGSALATGLYLWAISTGDLSSVFVAGILQGGLVYSAVNGLWPAFFTEMFDARVRFTGFAVGTQIGFLIAGFAPSIAFAIMGEGPTAWVPVALFSLGCGVVSAVAALTARETHRTPVLELGRR